MWVYKQSQNMLNRTMLCLNIFGLCRKNYVYSKHETNIEISKLIFIRVSLTCLYDIIKRI